MFGVVFFVVWGLVLVLLEVLVFFANNEKIFYGGGGSGVVKFFMYLILFVVFALCFVFFSGVERLSVLLWVLGFVWFSLLFHFLMDEYGKLEKVFNLVISLLQVVIGWIILYVLVLF